ncbi:MAG: mechanosensitive ion channel [Pyrinomonadaceae bacterium]
MRPSLLKKLRPLLAFLLIGFCVFSNGFSARAQENLFPNSNTEEESAESPTPTPTPAPTPIPISEVITQAEATLKRTQEIQKVLAADTTISTIDEKIPQLTGKIDQALPETRQILSERPSLETLTRIQQEWESIRTDVPGWKSDLQTLGNLLDKQIDELNTLAGIWQKTLNDATKPPKPVESPKGETGEGSTPPAQNPELPVEVKESIGRTQTEIKNLLGEVQKKRSALLTLQTRISEQEKRINEVLESIKSVREEALSHLLVRDSPAIWNAHRRTFSGGPLAAETRNSLFRQGAELSAYTNQNREGFIWHGAILTLLIFGLFWVRKRVRPLIESEPKIRRAMTVFQLPVATALVLSILLSGWFYPQAPRVLGALLGALALVPGILILRRLMEKPMFPILNALMIFYFIDRLRETFSALTVVSRYLFLAEMLGAIIFLGWFYKSKRLSDKIQVRHQRIFNLIKKFIPFALLVFSTAFIANALGYVGLSRIIGNGLLGSSYLALILYAAVRIIDSLLTFSVRVPPISTLGMVKTHRRLLQDKILGTIRWTAVIAWFILTLNVLSVREPVFNYLKGLLWAELSLGSLKISLADLLAFALTVWLAFALSRLIRFILNEDVYPRVKLAEGIPYAISTVLHYSILLVGFLMAIAAFGIDLGKFTILAGAFGVGLGFGLQNIVNNFVSGLILLFERPVKVGDVLQLGDVQGDLNRIGLRASVLRTLEGSEIIVPNGHLISEEVVNWTFSDRQRRIEINVGVAYGNDPEHVIEVLTKVALEHPDVLKEPVPRTLFIGFGDSSLDFQLRAWTTVASRWMNVHSDLAIGMHKALKEAGIEIPFPQRDLHIKTVNREWIEELRKKDDPAAKQTDDR